MKSRNAAKSLESNSRRASNLTVRYGAIGILGGRGGDALFAVAIQPTRSRPAERGSGRSADHDAEMATPERARSRGLSVLAG